MKLIKYPVLVLLLCSGLIGKAQFVFQSDTGVTNEAYVLHDAVLMENGSVVLCGSYSNYYGDGDPFVARLSPQGEWLQLKVLKHPSSEGDMRIIPTEDGGTLLACRSFGYPLPDRDGYVDILLLKLDTNFQEEWQHVLPAFDFADISTSTEEDFLAFGMSLFEHPDTSGPVWDYEYLHVHRLDKYGAVIWERFFTSGFRESTYRARIYGFSDGSSIVSSKLDTAKHFVHDQELGLLVKFDIDGNELYRKVLTPFHEKERGIMWPTEIFQLNGSTYYYRHNCIFEFNPEDGSEKLLKYLPNLTSIDANENGISAILGGYDRVDMTRLDENFNVQWSFNLYDDELGVKALSMPDGGSLFLYVEKDSITFSLHAVKTDCYGNYKHWNSCTVGAEEFSDSGVSVYPNPSSGQVQLKGEGIRTYSLFDARGALIQSAQHNPGQAISWDRKAGELYFLKVEGAFGSQVFKLLYSP